MAGLLLVVLMLFVQGCPNRAAGTDATASDQVDVVLEDLALDREQSDAATDSADAADVGDAADVRDVADVADAAVRDVFVACSPPDGALPDGASADTTPFDVIDVTTVLPDAGDESAPPRLIGPTHALHTTSQRPTLEWALPDGVTGARVELCRDRACTRPLATIDVEGTRVRPPTPLPAGVVVFWRARSITAAGVGTRTSATWEFVVPWRESPTDTFFGIMHDFNGDGYDDVAVGDPTAESFYIYHGSPEGLPNCPNRTVEGRLPRYSEFSDVLVAVGDINGDGYADLLVNARQPSLARTYLGSPTGIVPAPAQEFPNEVSDTAWWAQTVGAAGDVNGDGFSDVFITDSLGTVYLYFGSPIGLARSPQRFLGLDATGVGDADGDGYGDFADSSGRLYLGSASGPDLARFVLLEGASFSTSQGQGRCSAGDLNGDRYADWVIGGSGRARYFLGGSTIATRPRGVWFSAEAGNTRSPWPFGLQVGAPTDLNGDGYADVFVSHVAANAVLAFFGNRDGMIPAAGRIYHGRPGGELGVGLMGVGDTNGDGYGEFVAGDALMNLTSREPQVLVFRGSPTPSVTPFQVLLHPLYRGLSHGFGLSIASLFGPHTHNSFNTHSLLMESSSWQRSARNIASSM